MRFEDRAKEYHREYQKNNMTRISLNLSNNNDKDIIEAIETEKQGNKQAAIKSLIRKALRENR